MFRRGLIRSLAMALAVLVLLGIGGYAGWSQGFAAGLATGAGGIVPGYVPYAVGFTPVFFGLGLFFKVALMLLLVFMFFRVLGFFAWRMAGGPWGKGWSEGHHGPRDRRWSGHHHRGHGRHHEDSDEDEGDKARPDAESDTTETRV